MAIRRNSSGIVRREPRAFWHALLTGALSILTPFTSSGCDASEGGSDSGGGSDSADEPARFGVGTAAYEWVDESRLELLTDAADDHRIVPVRAWYPAHVAEADRAPYFLDPRQAELTAASLGLPADTLANIELPARVDAPLADGHEPFPVLIFSPGMGTAPEFYGYQLAELASRGYVVFALAHPYWTGSVVLSDGSVALELPEEPDNAIRDRAVATWSGDQRFALSRVQQLGQPGSGDRLAGRLDLERVGVFGHSRGGAAAAQSCLEDARFAACADVDGSVSTVVLESAISRPFLLLRSELSESTLEPFFASLTGPAHRVRIVGANHNDFCDLRRLVRDLDLPHDPASMLFGSLDADRVFEISAAYLDAFFDAELRGEGDAGFFEAGPFAEAEVTHAGSFSASP
jgi:hypothetical protein